MQKNNKTSNNEGTTHNDPVIIRAIIVLALIFVIGLFLLVLIQGKNQPVATAGTGNCTIPYEGITRLRIGSWDGGSICIKTHDADTISISEEANRELADNELVYYCVAGSTLEIKPSLTSVYNKLFGSPLPKNLIIVIPEKADINIRIAVKNTEVSVSNLCLGELRIETRDAEITASNLNMESISLSSAAGGVFADNIFANSIACRTSDCNAKIIGCASNNLECETSGGNIDFTSLTSPDSVKISSKSGNVILKIPVNSGICIQEKIRDNGRINCPSDFKEEKDCLIYGDGSRNYFFNAISGNIDFYIEQ